MEKEEQIKIISKLLHDNRPREYLYNLFKGDTGMFAVLKYLSEHGNETRSKDISDFMHISTARMAVILKTLEKKNYIRRINCDTDARVTNIVLTSEGENAVEQLQANMHKKVGKLIDEFGIDNLIQLFADMKKLKEIMLGTVIDIKEENND